MKKKWKVLITFVVAVILIGGLYTFTNWFSLVTGYFKGEDASTRLASCLNEKGAEFYFSAVCADCEKQESEFGTGFANIRQVDCGLEKEFCPNIREIPAWYIDKQIHYGFKTVNELKVLSECGQ